MHIIHQHQVDGLDRKLELFESDYTPFKKIELQLPGPQSSLTTPKQHRLKAAIQE